MPWVKSSRRHEAESAEEVELLRWAASQDAMCGGGRSGHVGLKQKGGEEQRLRIT